MTEPLVTDAATAPAPARRPARPAVQRLRPALGPGLVALTLLVFTLVNPGTFFTRSNLVDNVLLSGATLLVVASGQTVVMVVGDFDLSVGATASLAMVVSAKMLVESGGAPVWQVVLVGLAIGLGAGLLNGVLVSYAGVNAFIATLGTLTLFNGLGLFRTNAQPVYDLPPEFVAIGQGSTLGVGNPVWLALLSVVAVWFVLDHTPLGRRFYAVGGNAEAARYAGIDVRRTRLLAFVVAGLFASLAGVLTASYLETADPSGPLNLMLPSIAAVFLGTVMFRDGRPNAPGTLLGFVLWTVLASGLNQSGINTYLQTAAQGAILLLAVLPPAIARRRASR
ncbi:MAG TPA: ABC transporter permease [Kineosporiaceae bacterium]|nr:ABC transporter permease [Kineosporiaceae bacterium]